MLFALACLVAAKGANVSVPIIFKHLIDGLTITPEQVFIVVPAALLLAYGALRFSTSLLTELREVVFARDPAGGAGSRCACSATCTRCRCVPPRAPDRRAHARHRARHARSAR